MGIVPNVMYVRLYTLSDIFKDMYGNLTRLLPSFGNTVLSLFSFFYKYHIQNVWRIRKISNSKHCDLLLLVPALGIFISVAQTTYP